jgi:hypothetical protein
LKLISFFFVDFLHRLRCKRALKVLPAFWALGYGDVDLSFGAGLHAGCRRSGDANPCCRLLWVVPVLRGVFDRITEGTKVFNLWGSLVGDLVIDESQDGSWASGWGYKPRVTRMMQNSRFG